jgi:hypothetical protein
MLRKVLVIAVLIMISVVFVDGCKKRSGGGEPAEEAVKTMAEYEAQAEQEINEENMEDELSNIEEAVQLEESEEP